MCLGGAFTIKSEEFASTEIFNELPNLISCLDTKVMNSRDGMKIFSILFAGFF